MSTQTRPTARPTKIDPERIKAIKAAITLTNGRVTDAAALLGMPQPKLSKFLSHRALRSWWEAFKLERRRKRKREWARKRAAEGRDELAIAKRKLAALEDAGIDVDDIIGHTTE